VQDADITDGNTSPAEV
jgi:hypothetical protein